MLHHNRPSDTRVAPEGVKRVRIGTHLVNCCRSTAMSTNSEPARAIHRAPARRTGWADEEKESGPFRVQRARRTSVAAAPPYYAVDCMYDDEGNSASDEPQPRSKRKKLEKTRVPSGGTLVQSAVQGE